MSSGAFSQQSTGDSSTDSNVLRFIFMQLLNAKITATIVQVISCTNSGGLTAQGTVTVQPLVNQVTGNGTGVPHLPLYNVPYGRLLGGNNAVIIDPEPGDIGLVAFASRDISKVKATKAQANPGSARTFDWADGLYIPAFLNGVPTQYVQMLTGGAGINVVSPTQVTLQAPTVAVQGNLTVSGTTTGTGDGVFAGTDVHTHLHGGVQTGGGDTGPPV